MGNIIVDTENDSPLGLPGGSSVANTSQLKYDGSTLSGIKFTSNSNLNSSLALLNTDYLSQIALIQTNISNIATNAADILTIQGDITTINSTISSLSTDDIAFNHPGSPAVGDDSIVDLSSKSNLNLVLDEIITKIGDVESLVGPGFVTYSDIDIFEEDWVAGGISISASSPTSVTLTSGQSVTDGKLFNYSGGVYGLFDNKDNYIDIDSDGNVVVVTVDNFLARPPLGATYQNLYMLRVVTGVLTQTDDNRNLYPFDGINIMPDSILGNRLTDSGVVSGTYVPSSITIDSKGIITSAIAITGTTNAYVKYTGSGLSATSIIYDNGTGIGINVSDPQSTINISESDNIAINAGIPTGISAITVAGALPAATYYFAVAVVTSSGEGLISTEVSETSTGSEDIQVSWTKLAGAIGYRIFVGTSSGVYTEYNDVDNDTFSFIYTGTGTTGSPIGGPVTAYSTEINGTSSYFAEVLSVGTDNVEPSAIFEISSTTRGVLFPRMTQAQRDAIASPATSLVVFNTTTSAFSIYDGAMWHDLNASLDIGDIIGSSTVGSVLFVGASNDLQEDNAAFFWDNTDKTLTLTGAQHITEIAGTGTASMSVFNSRSGNALAVGLDITMDGDTITTSTGISIHNGQANTTNIGIEIDATGGTNNYAIVTYGGYVGLGTLTPTAALQVDSTTNGILIPRMTETQRNAIVSPVTSELVYNSTDGSFDMYISGQGWNPIYEQEHAETFIQSGAPYTTTFIGSATPTLLVATTVTANIKDFTSNALGRLTYNGAKNGKQFYVQYHLSGTQASGSNIPFIFYIYKNGVLVQGTEAIHNFSSSSRIQSVSGGGIIGFNTGDYIEVWIENNAGTQNFETTYLNLSLFSVE